MKKKLLSLALALVMCLGLTVPAFAAENPEDWWKNAKEVKNFEEFLDAVLDEKVEEIKIVGEVTIPKPVEYPLTVETPVLVGKEGKLTMAPTPPCTSMSPWAASTLRTRRTPGI